eukprot:s2311_g16.t1
MREHGNSVLACLDVRDASVTVVQQCPTLAHTADAGGTTRSVSLDRVLPGQRDGSLLWYKDITEFLKSKLDMAMQLCSRSGSPAVPTPEADLGPTDPAGDTAMIDIALGSADGVGTESACPPDGCPIDDATSSVPPGPVLSFGWGTSATGDDFAGETAGEVPFLDFSWEAHWLLLGGFQPGGGKLGGRGSLGGRPLGPLATAAPDFTSVEWSTLNVGGVGRASHERVTAQSAVMGPQAIESSGLIVSSTSISEGVAVS